MRFQQSLSQRKKFSFLLSRTNESKRRRNSMSIAIHPSSIGCLNPLVSLEVSSHGCQNCRAISLWKSRQPWRSPASSHSSFTHGPATVARAHCVQITTNHLFLGSCRGGSIGSRGGLCLSLTVPSDFVLLLSGTRKRDNAARQLARSAIPFVVIDLLPGSCLLQFVFRTAIRCIVEDNDDVVRPNDDSSSCLSSRWGLLLFFEITV